MAYNTREFGLEETGRVKEVVASVNAFGVRSVSAT